MLAEILERPGALPALAPRTAERLRPGWIYVAPPDCHLIVEPGLVRPTKGRVRTAFAGGSRP